jgi:hydrogenase maturation protease
MTQSRPDKQSEEIPPRIVIIGVGNLLLMDEGIGIHAVKALQEIDLPPDIKLIDGGTSPDLIAYTRAGDKIIIIDAARAGGEPGAIYCFKPEDLAEGKRSLVVENLNLMRLSGNAPREIVIIGIEPGKIEFGTELSSELEKRLPKIIEIVLKETGYTPRK